MAASTIQAAIADIVSNMEAVDKELEAYMSTIEKLKRQLESEPALHPDRSFTLSQLETLRESEVALRETEAALQAEKVVLLELELLRLKAKQRGASFEKVINTEVPSLGLC
eukprot:jgi/Chlat1/8132/Chrsp75S07577